MVEDDPEPAAGARRCGESSCSRLREGSVDLRCPAEGWLPRGAEVRLLGVLRSSPPSPPDSNHGARSVLEPSSGGERSSPFPPLFVGRRAGGRRSQFSRPSPSSPPSTLLRKCSPFLPPSSSASCRGNGREPRAPTSSRTMSRLLPPSPLSHSELPSRGPFREAFPSPLSPFSPFSTLSGLGGRSA